MAIKPLRYINRGMEPIEKVRLLISLTKIESEQLQLAVIDHLVRGFRLDLAASLNFTKQPHVTLYLTQLNKIATYIEKIHEYQVYNDRLREVETLMDLIGFRGGKQRNAIIQHMVYNETISISASLCNVPQGNLSRDIGKLKTKLEFINDSDYIKFIQHR